MKTKRFFLLTVIVLLSASALSRSPLPNEKAMPLLPNERAMPQLPNEKAIPAKPKAAKRIHPARAGRASRVNSLLTGVERADIVVLRTAHNESESDQKWAALTRQIKVKVAGELERAGISTSTKPFNEADGSAASRSKKRSLSISRGESSTSSIAF